MKPVLSAEEYRRVDKSFEGDVIQAMDRAGYAVALAAARHGAQYGKKVIVLAGPGNNGGDGYVAARYLKQRGVPIEVRALSEPKTHLASDALRKARAAGVPVRDLGEPVSAHLVIDALFGGGVRVGLPDSVRAWMRTEAPVVAVDYPTGLDPDAGSVDDEAFRAVETVTFSNLKTGHVRLSGPEHCGAVTVADIGIYGGRPSMYVAEEVDTPRPARERTAHKWSDGAVLVIGGSTGLVGASVFAGIAALNFGAGTVYVASPNAGLIHQIAPQIPTIDFDDLDENLARFDVLLAGPGLAQQDADLMSAAVSRAKRVVLDAGALTTQVLSRALEGGAEVIITPHAGEYERLTGLAGGSYSIRAFARNRGVTVLLKGNPTQVTDGGPPVLVASGGPELATIGTGDVLAGMISALWARGLDPVAAATSGAYWHGRAGADLSRNRTVTAEVLLGQIPSYAW